MIKESRSPSTQRNYENLPCLSRDIVKQIDLCALEKPMSRQIMFCLQAMIYALVWHKTGAIKGITLAVEQLGLRKVDAADRKSPAYAIRRGIRQGKLYFNIEPWSYLSIECA